ncbi:MAG TPA: hypothetical protein VN668_20435 [Stellaceae bacterium]|nr:hypothetical protein [Stellaceae bacterium]
MVLAARLAARLVPRPARLRPPLVPSALPRAPRLVQQERRLAPVAGLAAAQVRVAVPVRRQEEEAQAQAPAAAPGALVLRAV